MAQVKAGVLIVAGALVGCSSVELSGIVANGSTTSGASVSGAAGGTGAGATSGGADGGAGSSSSGNPSPAGPKRGFAYGYSSIDDLAVLKMGNVSWWQNWTDAPDTTLGDAGAYLGTGMEYVPMVWGAGGLMKNGLPDLQPLQAVPLSAKYLLTFHLPNHIKEANLSPSAAASAWRTIQLFAASRHLLTVSPTPDWCVANTDCTYTNPHMWLADFLASCANCQIDFIGVSAKTACDTNSLRTDLKQYEVYGKPLFISQLTCVETSDPAILRQYMQDAVSLLENDPMVFRYAWFIGRSGKAGGPPPDAGPGPSDLLAGNGSLTPLGMVYIGLPGPQ